MTPEIKRKIWVWIRGAFFGTFAYIALVLLSVWRWDWLWGWVYIGLLVAVLASHVIILVPINPALLADRSEGLRQKGSKKWDRYLVMLMGVFLLATIVVAGFDARWGWSDVPLVVHVVGILLYVLGWAIFMWAMVANPFFSESVRIRPDHQVAAGGPYRFVRHPGYAGACIYFIAQPMVFGSWWALVPAVLGLAVYVLRTALEDKTLQNELEGYRDYACQVRYRLVPGIW